MVTSPVAATPFAAAGSRTFTHESPASHARAALDTANHCGFPQGCHSHRLADVAGRTVAISPDVPAVFDVPLAPHHKLIGRWLVSREVDMHRYTRPGARRYIERAFETAVLDVLDPIAFVDLRVAVLRSEQSGAPAIAIICEGMGQIDLGWIEAGTAPVPWRAAVYAALERSLGRVLPIFGYHDLFEEISMYYWDGATEDDAAREHLIAWHGATGDDLDAMPLPSQMNARRPDWMIGAHGAVASELPSVLQSRLEALQDARDALDRLACEEDAWRFDFELACEFLPGIEECASLPPLTLVPFDQFDRELDEVARNGMEMGFMDIAGICPLPDVGRIDDWFASLHLGARFLVAAQDLLQFDPSSLGDFDVRP